MLFLMLDVLETDDTFIKVIKEPFRLGSIGFGWPSRLDL